MNPADYTDAAQLRQVLTQRAYEVFISEIMLQQTRVKTVIEYWTRWMDKWPTIYDLANANEDDVMSAWRGLGYYSRCKRILEACKKVVAHPDWQGLMPQDAKVLEAEIPGVGPYTAGAISSIVFGHPAPMVDGNVLRVLSRQLGLLGDIKADRTVIDIIWACATSLVGVVALDATPENKKMMEPLPNDAPGRWGQALMELGSTVCTPFPDCSACPITATCRAYQEGTSLARPSGKDCKPRASEPLEIEDLCSLCEPFTNVATAEAPKKTNKTSKQATLSAFFESSKAPKSLKGSRNTAQDKLSPEELEIVTSHVKNFPLRVAKKALREEETLVCAIRCNSDGSFLLQKRPEKGEPAPISKRLRGSMLLISIGLLAGMWELPSHILPESNDHSGKSRKLAARRFVSSIFASDAQELPSQLKHTGELGSVPWTFSHLKLKMHVHLFELVDHDALRTVAEARPRRWATPEDVEGETMGTGMRQCWKLITEALDLD